MSEMGKVIPFPRRKIIPVAIPYSLEENKAWAEKRVVEVLRKRGKLRIAELFEELRNDRQLPLSHFFIIVKALKRKGTIRETSMAEFSLASDR